MTDRELLERWLRPGAIVPVTMEATRILVEALRARLSQPEREWQDLTDDESDEIWGECLGVFDCLKMTQAKLKEKNT